MAESLASVLTLAEAMAFTRLGWARKVIMEILNGAVSRPYKAFYENVKGEITLPLYHEPIPAGEG